MKKRKLCFFVLVPLIGAVVASLFVSSASRRGSATVPQLDETPASRPWGMPAAAPSPALGGSNIWQRPPVPDEPVKREVRLQIEPAFMETAGEAIGATIPAMGFSDEEGSKIRQAFSEYKTGCLRVIRGPGAFRSDSDPTEAALPWNVYHHQLREILGEERAEKFENEYRDQRLRIVKARRTGDR
jgi:hypothetical protein